jgi:hypothetical protein
MKNKIKKFRNGIFLASSRRCGETYMEPILRKYFGWNKSDTTKNDAINADGKYVEIKCSKVLIKLLKSPSLTESVILENDNFILKRLIKFDDRYELINNSNIQNIKRHKFDILTYIMLFKDCIQIFESTTEDISDIPGWSGKHGGEDKKGKNGQFGITKTRINWHLDNNLIQTLTWEEVYEISDGIII